MTSDRAEAVVTRIDVATRRAREGREARSRVFGGDASAWDGGLGDVVIARETHGA